MMLRHIVLFKLDESFTAEKKVKAKEKLVGMLKALDGQIPGILEFEVGVNVNEEPSGYDIVLESGFEGAEALERYRVHPAHQEVFSYIKEVCSQRAVVDYQK